MLVREGPSGAQGLPSEVWPCHPAQDPQWGGWEVGEVMEGTGGSPSARTPSGRPAWGSVGS